MKQKLREIEKINDIMLLEQQMLPASGLNERILDRS